MASAVKKKPTLQTSESKKDTKTPQKPSSEKSTTSNGPPPSTQETGAGLLYDSIGSNERAKFGSPEPLSREKLEKSLANLPSEKKKKKQLIQDVDELLTELEEQQRIIESLRSMYERQNRELEIYKKQWLASAGAEATPELLKHVQAASACWAASNGRVDLLKNMLENGGDIYQANPDGRTALHMAAAGDQLEAVEFLIKSGAPIHAIDRYGCSPLMEAVDCQHTAVAMSLEIAEALQSVRRLEREYKLGEYIAPGYEIILQTTTIPRLQRKISKLLSNPRSTIPVGQREMPRLIGSASQPSMVTATNTGANAAVPLSMASPPYSGSHGKQASKVLSGNAGATLRKAEKKRTRPSSTFRKLFVDAWLKDNKASKEDDILLHGEPRFTSPRQKKSGSPPAPFGVAFGVLRGTCQVPECDCKFYKKSSAGATCSCGHFPASHLNLGEADMLKGLEHMKMIDERTVTLLVPRDVGVGPDAWPKMLNREVPMDDDTGEVLSQLSRDIVQRQLLIHPDEVVFTRQIGQGSSATVYEGIYKNQKVAIKMINFRPSDKRPREKQRQEIVEEFHIMKAIDDPHVLKFHGVVAQPRLCIVLEYCAMGSLYDVLNRTEEDDAEDIEMDWHTVFRWFTETVEGVAALHSFKHQIVHRDLKSLNLLIDDTLAIKVADFGLSRFLSEEAHQTTLGKLRGTYAYCAPEVYFGEFYSPKSDVYSLAIILWELVLRTLTGKYHRPYAEYPLITFDFQIIIQAAKKNTRPTIPSKCPAALAELITKLWSPKPDQRPDCATLLKMVREVEANYQSNKEEWDSIVNTVECLSMSTDEMSLSSGSSTPSVSPLFNMGGTSGPYGPGSLSSSSFHTSLTDIKDKRKSSERSSRSTVKSEQYPEASSSNGAASPPPPPVGRAARAAAIKKKSRENLGTGQIHPAGQRAIQFEELAHDVLLFSDFKSYLAARLNSENLLFWEDVHKFKTYFDENDKDKARSRAMEILKKYVSGEKFNGEFVVAMSPAIERDLNKFLGDGGSVQPHMFDSALQEVEYMTLKPTFMEFIKNYTP